jgi:hypothetical protein
MYNILHRSSIAIYVAMLVLISSHPVLAKPQAKSKVVVISQAVTKASVDDTISPQPVEAILAGIRLKQASQLKAKKAVVRPAAAAKSLVRIIKTDDRIDAKSLQGIDSFIGVDRVNSDRDRSTAIDRWTN